MNTSTRYRPIAIAVLMAVLAAGIYVHVSVPIDDNQGNDIYRGYAEGKVILSGVNPYLRILDGNMRENQKYPTYFPAIYLISALMERLGLQDYGRWLGVFRWLSLVFNVGCGCLIFDLLHRRKGLLLAALATLFWFLSRWDLQITRSVNFSFLPVFFLLLALWLMPRYKMAAALALSLSLALKQVGILIVPLFLIWVWQASPKNKLNVALAAALVTASVSAFLCLPFVFWPGNSIVVNALGVFKSVAFTVTRDAYGYLNAASVDVMLGLTGVAARLPILGLAALVYIGYARGKLGIFSAGLLAMAAAIDFNPVLFVQYFCWLVPFILLSVSEVPDRGLPGKESKAPIGCAPGVPVATPRVEAKVRETS